MINGEMNHIPSTLSKSCKDFIHRVLTANPDKRPAVDEILQHRWLKEAIDYRYDQISPSEITKKIMTPFFTQTASF